MARQVKIESPLWRDPSDGIMKSSYFPPDPNSWRTASLYTPVTAPLSIEFTTLKSNSGASAYHKWASPHFEYKAYVGFKGGLPPFRITLLDSPDGATIGPEGKTQTMIRTADATVSGIYNHGFPTYNCAIRWQPTEDEIGQTKTFQVLVEDCLGNWVINSHSVKVEDNFIFVDGDSGNDANAGTWSAPKKTFDSAHNNAGKICVYKTAGTYAVTFGGLNNSDNRSRAHIGLVSGVKFDVSGQHFGCSSAADDITFINIEFNGTDPAQTNARIFNMSGKVTRALWWGCRWRDTEIGTIGNDNPACIALMSLGNPPGTDSGGRGPYLNLPQNREHEDITVVECDTDETVYTQLITAFSARRVLWERNTAKYPATPQTVGGNNNGSSWLHAKDSCSDITARFNVLTGGGFILSAINFSNQRGFYCSGQEAVYNFIKWDQGTAISFNRQATLAGFTEDGQRIGAENCHCVRNTCISSTNGVIEFLRWGEMANIADPVIVEGNIIATTHATGISTVSVTDGGLTQVGLNPKAATTDFDSSLKLTGTARTTYLGKQGAEIASTLVE